MATVYLLTGSNLGDRTLQLQQAAARIDQQAGSIEKSSLCYETAPWGKTDQPAFLNQALCITTVFSPTDLLRTLLSIEQQLGRVRAERYGPRAIDIDILLYDDWVVQEDQLAIPHPELPYRRFALLPLAEIAPLGWHPTLKCTVEALLLNCTDQSPVHPLD
jgi:2-amino-4-hydroxy-6-hydroxymethyldihydropteridine diphosphokinase